MKKYKLCLLNYEVLLETGKKTYKVREVLANILCHPSLKLVGYKFYENAKLGDKIINCTKDYIIFSLEEHEKIKKVFDKFEGFGRSDSELVKRIYEMEQIDIKEKEI